MLVKIAERNSPGMLPWNSIRGRKSQKCNVIILDFGLTNIRIPNMVMKYNFTLQLLAAGNSSSSAVVIDSADVLYIYNLQQQKEVMKK